MPIDRTVVVLHAVRLHSRELPKPEAVIGSAEAYLLVRAVRPILGQALTNGRETEKAESCETKGIGDWLQM